jgi:hypothetical protein
LLSYLQIRIRYLINTVKPGSGEGVSLDLREWQTLLDLQNRLAKYLRQIGSPYEEEG